MLLGLGSPFLNVVWGGVDATVLPASAAPRIVTEALNTDFPGNPTAPIETIVQFRGPVAGSPGPRRRPGRLRSAAWTTFPASPRAQLTGIRGDIARIDLSYGPGPYTPQARAIAGNVRDVAAPARRHRAYTGGQTAALADELSSLGQTLPWMALAVVLATFVLLFLAFGSLILPLQAIVMNILSLAAMYGVVTWIFQDGHLSGLLGFTPNGTISPTIPILMFAIMFGLSMDYQVFLLSRIRESYDITGDNTAAIAQRPAAHRRRDHQRRAAADHRDRPVLPVQHHLHQDARRRHDRRPDPRRHPGAAAPRPRRHAAAGDANWWAPGPLRRFYARHGIHEDDSPAPGAVQAPAPEPAGT